MRVILTFCLLFPFVPMIGAKDTRNPTIKIYDVNKGSEGGLAVLDFFISAKDNEGIKGIEYRAAVDGKQSGWKKYPYYAEITNHLYFKVDCNVFTLEVRSIDRAKNKSKIVRKTFSGLKG